MKKMKCFFNTNLFSFLFFNSFNFFRLQIRFLSVSDFVLWACIKEEGQSIGKMMVGRQPMGAMSAVEKSKNRPFISQYYMEIRIPKLNTTLIFFCNRIF